MASKYVGQRIKRVEDPRLVQGLGRYVDDIRLPGALHVCFVRSIHSHARLSGMDVTEAKQADGVVAVYTGKDIEREVGPIMSGFKMPPLKVTKHPVLANGKVYFVGHPIAAVVATDLYRARDAVDLIAVDYEPLPAVVDLETAGQSESRIHEEFEDNVAYQMPIGSGDVDKALEEADCVVRQRMVNQRVAPMAMEGRGVLARYDPGSEELTLWSSTQIPHLLKSQLAQILRLSEHKVRVIAPEVGGGFGAKINIYAEEAMLGWISKQLSRPVKWIETRRENMQASTQGRGQEGVVELGCKKDGTITALRYSVLADLGSHCQMYTPVMPMVTAMMVSGCYKIPAVQTNITAVFTNKVPTDSYRGAGGPEATYVIERAIDMAAAELGLDPVEMRRRNFIQPEEFPYQTATGVVYDCGNYEGALDKALAMIEYEKLRESQAQARQQGRIVGIGVSTYAELCGVGPSKGSPTGFGCWESATVRVDPSGKITVLTGTSPHGQGGETTFAQITADALGVELDDITVIHGDTQAVQYGIGTYGSRATAVGGAALVGALDQVKEKAVRVAAHLLETEPEKIHFCDGRFSRECGEETLTFEEVAMATYVAGNLPDGMEPALWATYVFDPKNFTASFGTHVAVVEIDKETGEIQFQRYVCVDDCGKVINPLLVDGQLHGGIAQAIGQALFEEVVYDENGQLLTGELLDYAVPRAHHLPRFEVDSTETPSPINPLGAKGVGEAGTIGGLPVVVNAIVDALAPYGVTHIDMPIKPEKIWRIIRNSQSK